MDLVENVIDFPNSKARIAERNTDRFGEHVTARVRGYQLVAAHVFFFFEFADICWVAAVAA